MSSKFRIWVRESWRRLILGVTGLILVGFASRIYYDPPIRVTITNDGERGRIVRTEEPADTSAVTVALLTAGALAIVYGLNLKIPSFGLADNDNSQAASSQVPDVMPPQSPPHTQVVASQPPLAAVRDVSVGEGPEREITAAVDRELLQRAEYFFRVSSWNGKKVLYASYLASRTPSKILDLRGLCRRDKRMSFDYAFGYFIASSSAGVFQHSASGDGTFLEVRQFPEILATLLLKHIEGQLSIPLEDRAVKCAEIRDIAAFFQTDGPPFVQ